VKRVCEDVQHQVCAAPDRPFMVAKRRGDTVIAIMPTLWNLVPGVGPTAAQGGVVTLLTLCRPSPAYESCLSREDMLRWPLDLSVHHNHKMRLSTL
jgi:hypothetical protein